MEEEDIAKIEVLDLSEEKRWGQEGYFQKNEELEQAREWKITCGKKMNFRKLCTRTLLKPS